MPNGADGRPGSRHTRRPLDLRNRLAVELQSVANHAGECTSREAEKDLSRGNGDESRSLTPKSAGEERISSQLLQSEKALGFARIGPHLELSADQREWLIEGDPLGLRRQGVSCFESIGGAGQGPAENPGTVQG